jgi:hypothetical protein
VLAVRMAASGEGIGGRDAGQHARPDQGSRATSTTARKIWCVRPVRVEALLRLQPGVNCGLDVESAPLPPHVETHGDV